MFDIGADELLLTAVVAIVVIGPKDLPRALRTVGKWVAKMRRMSNAFRSGIENVIREAELEDMEEQWRKQNAAIMEQHPALGMPNADAESAAATAAGYGEAADLADNGDLGGHVDFAPAPDPQANTEQPPSPEVAFAPVPDAQASTEQLPFVPSSTPDKA